MPARLFVSSLPDYSLAPPNQVEFFFSFFSFLFFFFTLTFAEQRGVPQPHAGPVTPPVPHASWFPCPSPLCFPLTLHMHTPCHRPYHLAPLLRWVFFIFFFLYF